MGSRAKKKQSRYQDFSESIIPNVKLKPKKEFITMANTAKEVIPHLDALKLKHSSVMTCVRSFIGDNPLWHTYYPAIEDFVYKHSDVVDVVIKEIPETSTVRFIIYEDKKGVTCMGSMDRLSLTYEHLDAFNPYVGVVSLTKCLGNPELGRCKEFDLLAEAENMFAYFNKIVYDYMYIASYFANHKDNNIVVSSPKGQTHNFIRHTDTWFRRGHWRTLPNGKKIWVKPTTCGDKSKSHKSKAYLVE
jgi:hypothetical protein